MSTKRAQAREWKRKRKQRKHMALLGVTAFVVLVAAAFGFFALDNFSKSYVMTFEGTRINNNDFLFNVLNAAMRGSEDPKADGLDQLLDVLVLEHRAKAEGIVLTEDEKEEMLAWAANLRSNYRENNVDLSFLSDQRLAEIISSDIYHERLMDIHTEGLVIDEVAFNRAFADYKENNRLDYVDAVYKYAFNPSQEDLEAARERLTAGEITFDELAAELCVMFNHEGEEAASAMLWQFGLADTDNEHALSLQPGEASRVMLIDEYYIILQMETITIPEEEELSANFRQRFTEERKAEAFSELMLEWKREANFTVNQRGYDAL
jgi:hypothetical protein